MFNPNAELVIPTGTKTNEANAETEMQPVTVETKISKFSIYFKYLHVFYIFHSLNYDVLFLVKDKLLLLPYLSLTFSHPEDTGVP